MGKRSATKKLPSFLNVAEAAKALKVGEERVLEWTASGRLRAVPSAEGHAYSREDILVLLDELDMERPGPPMLFPIVAIGASAGGLEAMSELLEALAPDLGMAYVFISHLSPDHKSLLAEILQKRTTMPVHKVENGMFIERNSVYVIPPDAEMSIVDGVLTLKEPRDRTKKNFLPVNSFMIKLAEVYQMNAIGIVLSGTGSDGTLGLKAVRAGGGWTFTQDTSAKFGDMPRNAQQAGVVDFVLSPRAIARQLGELHRLPLAGLAMMPRPQPTDASALQEILVLLHRRTDVDFTQYKRSTVNRRILRRMILHRLPNLSAYAKMLQSDIAEREHLFEDLLINVTVFFREPRFFQALAKRVLPRLIEGRSPNDTLRIWVAGCSTGEEAVSIAIVLAETLDKEQATVPVQIFATDLDLKAIEVARSGVYSKVAMENVSQAHKKKYFVHLEGKYQVTKTIRDMLVFAHHDLLKDPPFSRIDLLSCQNVLIYLDTHAQQKVLRSFHYALRPLGYLALGRSETVNPLAEQFIQVEKDYKIFSKRGGERPLPIDVPVRKPNETVSPDRPEDDVKEPPVNAQQELDREAERLLLHRHAPASVVVNKDLTIVRFRGNTAPYMAPQAGRASLNLLKMVREDLAFELRGLLRKVKGDRVPLLRSGLEIMIKGVPHLVSIEVVPMRVSLEEDHYLIVFLEESSVSAPQPPVVPSSESRPRTEDEKARRIALLEREVRDVREQMRILMEEAEANSEQLQTAHEEVLSSNEELQSMNEELETSKEELQSANEELTTINDELVQRHDQLKEARDYAESIISTLDTPLVILNGNMRVKMANRAFYRTFRTSPAETEGILIHELGNHQWDVNALRKHLFEVLAHGREMHDFEVRHTYPEIGDRNILLNAKRIDHHDTQQRLLITMEDVTERRRTEQALSRLAAIVTSSDDAILSMDLQGTVLTWNEGAHALYGYAADEMIGGSMDKLIPADRSGEEGELLRRISKGERIDHYETVRLHRSGRSIPVSLMVSPLRDPDGAIVGVSKISRDLTRQKQIEASLQESQERFHLLADNMDQLAWITGPDGKNAWFNKRWEEYTGIASGEIEGRMSKIQHPEYAETVVRSLRASMEKGRPWEAIMPLRRADGRYRWFLGRTTPLRDASGKVLHWFGTNTDITDRMRAEEALRMADRRKDEFLATLAHELRNPLAPLRSGFEVLDQAQSEEERLRARGIMKRQVDHMVRLVDDLLDVGRISSGRLVLMKGPMEIAAALDMALDSVRPSISAKGQHLDVHVPRRSLVIEADAARITQVLSNLLHNASKFTPQGGHITVRVDEHDDRVDISVQDDGVGIPENMIERVFDMFAQVDPSERSKAGGGLGIGLHIVQRIVSMHGGEVMAESAGKGTGTTFRLWFPLMKGHQVLPVEEHVAPQVNGERVLVVDDNEDSTYMLAVILRAAHCDTRIANSGDEALRLGEAYLPTVVLLDIGMPDMDGYETCRRIRATEWGRAIRIIALTGWGQEEDKEDSRSAGFDGHLVKPVDRMALLEAIGGASSDPTYRDHRQTEHLR